MRPAIKVFSFILIIILFHFSCENPQKTDEYITEKDLDSLEIPENTEALVTFISGDVEVLNNGSWETLFIGDLIEAGKTVKVYVSSFCELQFGDRAVVKVQENTEIVLDSVFFEEGGTDIELDVIAGSLLCKVEKLAGNESFNVETNSSVCGVRGTEFMVKEDSSGTILAVKEGRVAVLPVTVDIDSLINKVESENISEENAKQIKTIIKKIEESASVVSDNEEIFIDSSLFSENAEQLFNEVEEYIDEIIVLEQLESKGITAQSKVNLVLKVESVISSVSVKGSEKELTQENRSILNQIDNMKIINIKHQASAVSTQTEEKEEYYKISVNLDPDDSAIYLNGELQGYGNYSGIFDEGAVLDFKFTKEGYLEKTFKVNANKDIQYDIIMQPEEVQELVVTASDNTVNEDTALPEDSETENTSAELKPEPVSDTSQPVEPEKTDQPVEPSVIESAATDTVESVADSLETQPTEPDAVEDRPDEGIESDSQITSTSGRDPVINKYSISNANIVGNINVFEGNLIAADRRGSIICSDFSSGEILYKINTENNPNDNSFPVIIEGCLYFTGNIEFIIADADDGEVEETIDLDSNTAHAYGQRVARLSDDLGLFPAHDSIQFIDLENGEVEKQVKIPNSLSMTPIVYRDKVYVANQNGVMLVIDPESGNIENTVSTRVNMPVGISIKIVNNMAVFAGRMGNVVCYNIGSDAIVWERELIRGSSMYVFQDIEAGRQGVYIISKGTLFGLSLNNGNDLFSPVSGISSPPGLYNGILYFGSDSEQLVAINAGTGAVMKSLYLGEKITTRPILFEGNIIVGTEVGNIIVVNPENM